MQDNFAKYSLVVLLLLGWVFDSYASGLSLIKASDSEITVELDVAHGTNVKLLEMEPYDTLNPLRGLISDRSDCQQLDLSHDGFLRVVFSAPSAGPFDPQLQFPASPVNADYVAQFSMRVRVSGTADGADMPFRIFGLPAPLVYRDISVPADGQWHIVRADMSDSNWNGIRTLRIDPANNQSYAPNANAVVDFDWIAMTWRADFTGGRDHTGLDVFVDLGMPVPSWSGPAQREIELPRFDGLRDRLYSKYILTDGGVNQIGNARFVTDLSNLSYREDSLQGWSANTAGLGLSAAVVSNGILSAKYSTPTVRWDPMVQENGLRLVNLDCAGKFAMKYRVRGYTGGRATIPLAIFGFISGESGFARLDDELLADGAWHVYRTRLDQSATDTSWHGSARLRIDAPNADVANYPAADFDGAVFELDWLAVSDDPMFTPSRPLCEGGQCWTFTTDRTAPLRAPAGFKGLSGPVFDDFVDLGVQIYKMNCLQRNLLDLKLNPSEFLQVDEFQIGINTTYLNQTLLPLVRKAYANGMAVNNTFLNGIEDYWIDEGTSEQRFHPLRNPLTVSDPPNSFSVAHNVMDPMGLAYYRGVFEYLGRVFSEHSRINGEMYRFTISNEIDSHWSWYNLGEIEFERVIEIYLTSCRIADLALRSQHPDYRVYISLTHYWNRANPQGVLRAGKPKEFIERFAARAKEEGDFPWALCIHPYPVPLTDAVFWNDPTTDDFNSEYVTFKNLSMIRRFMQQRAMLYNGQPRPINLGEQGFHVTVDGDVEDEAIQAAALAYSFKIVEQVPDVEAYLYHRQIDHSLEGNLRFGLWTDDGNPDNGYQTFRKRPSWNIMRDYGTVNESATFAPYLTYLPISSWSEINPADIVLRYYFDQPDVDIKTGNLPVYGTSNGVLWGKVDSIDPQIINQNINTYGDGQEKLLLRLKTSRGGHWQFFWRRDSDPGFAQERSILVTVGASSEFQFYTADLSGNALWNGCNITGWRLDPVSSGSSPYSFEIDYLCFGAAGDFDGDGIPDIEEGTLDIDNDGVPNFADMDSNGNGWSDSRMKLWGLNPHSLDSSGDGISDFWKIQNGYDPFDATDADWDADSDGFTTWAEYIAGTDPADRLDYFVIQNLEGATVQVQAKAGRTYALWTCDNLNNGNWRMVVEKTATSDTPLFITDETNKSTTFYRVEVKCCAE